MDGYTDDCTDNQVYKLFALAHWKVTWVMLAIFQTKVKILKNYWESNNYLKKKIFFCFI